MSRIFDLVRLNLTGRIGARRFRSLMEACETTSDIFRLSPEMLQKICAVGPKTAQRVLDPKYKGWAGKELDTVEKKGYSLVVLGEKEYPAILDEAPDPPLVLYVRGQSECLGKTAISIVGTRRCSRYGREIARSMAGELAALGITIVSGLALGIDGEAHEGALEAGGTTIAVLGSGIDEVYPSEHSKLAQRIESSGAVVSEFPLGSKPRKENFPRRNRVISGLAHGVLVVEAPLRSGALITARTAAEQGREVFAVPGRIDSAGARGCHGLIRDGAKLTQSVKDILEEIAPQLAPAVNDTAASPELEPPSGLTEEEEKIFKVLDRDPVPIDTVIVESGLAASAVTGALLKLQLMQLVDKLPGNRFARK